MTTLEKSEVENLISRLRKASEDYYQNGIDSGMTDAEFDSELEDLRILSIEHPELFEEGTDGYLLLEGAPGLGSQPVGDKEVVHNPPMLSLAKAKIEDHLFKFLDKTRSAGATSFTIQAKLDGLALSAEYENGSLVRLSKRGNGYAGDDITYLFNSKEITIVGLPSEIGEKNFREIRGELYFTEEQFKNADSERVKAGLPHFENSRNAVSGLSRKSEKGIGYPVEMSFCCYGIYDGKEALSLSEETYDELYTISQFTRDMVDGQCSTTDLETNKDVMEAVSAFGVIRAEKTQFPTDGVVIKPTNEAEMLSLLGATGHHPLSQIAWKYPSELAETTIEDIVVTVGRVGKLTPVARVTPTRLSGTTISNVTLHNFSQMALKGFRIGSVIRITRVNDVIPYAQDLVRNPKDSKEFEIPSTCPLCGKDLFSKSGDTWPPKYLSCINKSCPARTKGSLYLAVGKGALDLDGMSTSLVHNLEVEGKISTIADFFDLSVEDLKDQTLATNSKGKPIRLGESRAKNICDHIEKAKSLPLSRYLISLGIETLGGSTASILVEHFEDLDRILDASVSDLEAIPSIGHVKAEAIQEGLQIMRPILDDMKKKGVDFSQGLPKDRVIKKDSRVSGLSFSISGPVPGNFANRGAFVEWLELNGASFDGSPGKETNYMIADRNGSSSKIKKALSLGIEFVTAEEFESRFL